MEPPRLRCLLVTPDGVSRRVGRGGLLIGRQRDCDIVGADPGLSRRHALVHLTATGAELVPLGKTPIDLNRRPCTSVIALADADELCLPGLTLIVRVAAARPDPQGAATYRLVWSGGGSFGIVHSPFFIGGDPSDDLIVADWPTASVALRAASIAQARRRPRLGRRLGLALGAVALVAAGVLRALPSGPAADEIPARFARPESPAYRVLMPAEGRPAGELRPELTGR